MTRDYRNYNYDVEMEYHKCNRRRRKKSDMGSSLTCIGIMWTFLSFVSMGLSCVGFYLPYWLEGITNNDTPTSLGTFRRCNYPTVTEEGEVLVITECGRYSEWGDIPSFWWKVTTITVGVGCGLTILVSFFTLLSCCVKDVISQTSAKVGGALQFLAGLSIGAGCLLYPLGWESAEVKGVCGSTAQLYNLGECSISWAYWTTIGGAGGCLLCALLSCNAAKDNYSTPTPRYHR